MSAKLARGELLDNNDVIFFFKKEFALFAGDNIVIDGFPRTLKQADYLDSQLNAFKVFMVSIDLTIDDVIGRAATRVVCSHCGRAGSANNQNCLCGSCVWQKRTDDLNDIPKSRYKDYCSYKNDILSFYKKKGNVISMDGSLPTEVLCASICDLVSKD